MTQIHRCPKCRARFAPPRVLVSECPHCGIWFHKWRAVPALDEESPVDVVTETSLPAKQSVDSTHYWGRVLALVLVSVWGVQLVAMDYRVAEINGSFMHYIVLPIHEAGHVFFIPFGEFMTILGGSLFQVMLPLGIGAAFLLRQHDPFGAAICLWWAGASVVDVAPYIWDSLSPQLILIGGHTGEDGPHDWIYLLTRLGAMQHAHAWGAAVHRSGALMMLIGAIWGGRVLWCGRSGKPAA